MVIDKDLASIEPSRYQIIVSGELNQSWSEWFDGIEIHPELTKTGEAITVLSGGFYDQSALRGMLNKIWDLRLTLIAVEKLDR
ncbi:MAG: hypothetical protein ABUK20_12835 [Anaerolineales bacterium]|jgi:hypothetical protein